MLNCFRFFCLLLIVLIVPVLASCGQRIDDTKVEVIEQNVRAERLGAFDSQLGEIKDESSAKTAIITFADYVEGSPNSSSLSASTTRLFSTNLIDHLAKQEISCRQKILNGIVSSYSATEEGLITSAKLTAAINAAKDPAFQDIRVDEVEFIQAGVRSELPNIAPKPPLSDPSLQGLSITESYTNIMTPIEAMVIGYVIATADDGSAGPGANASKLPADKVELFLNNITE